MFKHTMIAAAAMLATAACTDTPTVPDFDADNLDALYRVGGAEKLMVCHLDAEVAEPDEDGPGWELLEVPNNRALEKHLAHGDGVPGGDVPGMLGYAFDDACVPTATEPKVFAVAYVDRNPGDGGYQEGTDDLIAKLVDRNRDGVISVGDEVIRGQYPLDFGATALGQFGVSSNLVVYVWPPSSSEVVLSTGFDDLDMVYFYNDPTFGQHYLEDRNDEISIIWLRDNHQAGYESIKAVFDGGLSKPQTAVDLLRDALTTDDAFVDVEIDLDGF